VYDNMLDLLKATILNSYSNRENAFADAVMENCVSRQLTEYCEWLFSRKTPALFSMTAKTIYPAQKRRKLECT
jgi:hypothetical protein